MELVTCRFCGRIFLPKNPKMAPKYCNKRCYMEHIKSGTMLTAKEVEVKVEKKHQGMNWSLVFIVALALVTAGLYVVSKLL